MRRSRELALAVCAALLLTSAMALSAQAAQRSAYTIYRADCGYDFSGARQWESDGVLHIRGIVAYHVNYFLIDGSWVQSGTNVTTANVNGKTVSHTWGTFEMRNTIVGDYDGTWTWGNSPVGNATGQGIGDAAGWHLNVELLGERPAGVPDPPVTGCPEGGWELWSVH